MKYLFVIGDNADFDNATFREFMQIVIDLPSGKPFQMFLHKFKAEILQVEYPYLSLEGDTQKKLSLYPNIVLKCVDIGL